MKRRGVLLITFVTACVLLSRPLPLPAQSNASGASATILAKTPVFAGACKACPWGILAKVTADALSFYGYQTKIYVRDDAPDDFAYTVPKALDEHRDLFQVQLEPWYYDHRTVADSKTIPLHPGALKYYRERGYIK